jgi:NitT/TauT family transport system substrate-binding protein
MMRAVNRKLATAPICLPPKRYCGHKIKSLIVRVFSWALLVFWGVPCSAQLTKINVAYGGAGGDPLPVLVAKEAGIFDKNGLDARLIFFTGGTTSVLALISGDVQIGQVAGSAVVNSAVGGSDLVMVAGGITSLNYWLMGRSDVKTPAQLRGGSVAISRFGSATDFIARFALPKVGLTPGRDVAIVQIGDSTARLGAILTGRVHGAVLGSLPGAIAQKKGMHILADVAKMGLAIQHTGVATTRRFIKGNRDLVRKYVKSQVEAVHRIWTDKEGTIRAFAKYAGSGVEREILEKIREGLLSEAMLSKKQYPSLEGLKTILASMAETDPRVRTAKPEEYMDVSFIKELDQSGYIDSLYRN